VYVPMATDNQSIQPYVFALHVLSFTSFQFIVALAALCCFEEKIIRVNLMRQGFIPFHVSHQVFVRTPTISRLLLLEVRMFKGPKQPETYCKLIVGASTMVKRDIMPTNAPIHALVLIRQL
jgi:hypothetical protein